MTSSSISDFIQYYASIKRASKHTLIAYQNDLDQFQFFMHEVGGEPDLIIASHLQIRSWMVVLLDDGLSVKAINRKISTLRSYYKYLIKHNHISKNPMLKVIAPKIPKRLPSVVKRGELELALESTLGMTDYKSKRDHLILLLFYQTGIRRSELIQLKVEDFDLSRQEIRVLGKGKKERLIPVSKDLALTIEAFKSIRESISPQSMHLFLTEKGNALYPKAVYNIVSKILKQVSTVKKSSPHTLRHSFATHLLENGAELLAVKELLGHASLTATQVYTHNNIVRLQEVYEKAHPKG